MLLFTCYVLLDQELVLKLQHIIEIEQVMTSVLLVHEFQNWFTTYATCTKVLDDVQLLDELVTESTSCRLDLFVPFILDTHLYSSKECLE